MISHDRWFLDRTCTHILAWEGTDDDPAKWYFFEGNFSDYEKNKVSRLGVDAARPHRVTHRKLTRDELIGNRSAGGGETGCRSIRPAPARP